MSKPRRLIRYVKQADGTTTQVPTDKWIVQWYDHDGKRHTEQHETEKNAARALRLHRVDVDNVKVGNMAPPPPEAPRCPTLETYLTDTFLPALDVPGRYKASERTTTRSIARRHLQPALGDRRLDEITRAVGLELRETLARGGLAPKTVHNILLLLTRILRHAHDREALRSDVPSFAEGKAAKRARRAAHEGIRREEYLDRDEFDLLVAAADSPALRALVLVAGRAGLRSGELRALQWGDIDLAGGTITVRRSEYRGTFDTPKSGVARTVPLGARVREALQELGRGLPAGWVFTTPKGEHLTEKAMTLDLIALGARAGVRQALSHRDRMRECRFAAKLRKRGATPTPAQTERVRRYDEGDAVRFGWHVLRHTFCSHLAMAGTPAIKIQAWAGHASIVTTERYMHLAPSERQASRAIDALDRPVLAAL